MPEPDITPCFVSLPNRGLITVTGEETFKFLQNIVTNDLNRLDHAQAVHSCLLTAQGKYLHDFFMSKTEGGYLLDCEGGERARDLLKRLTLYRLRSKINFGIREENPVYAIFKNGIQTRGFEKPDLPEQPFSYWDERRIRTAAADGRRDAEIEKSTLAELNMEDAIDYNKGCYVGQELTARIHHRGLAKKHLFPVRFETAAPPYGTALFHNGRPIGEMRSSQGKIGLALVKDEVLPPPEDGFSVLDIPDTSKG